jgi:hypothetical protein
MKYKKESKDVSDLVDLCELNPWVGGHPVGRDLPEQDSEGPDIRLSGEPGKRNYLKHWISSGVLRIRRRPQLDENTLTLLRD